MTYTASEMREMAKFHKKQADQMWLEASCALQNGREEIVIKRSEAAARRAEDTAQMLRQAADAMEGKDAPDQPFP